MPESNTHQRKPRLVRRKDIQALFGFSASTADRLEAAGKFPKRIKLGGSVGIAVRPYDKCVEAVDKLIEEG